jgi:hypothetical protein
VINVLKQAAVKPRVILIRSFSVDRAKVVYKLIYIHGKILFGILAFFTRLRCQFQFRKLYGYRILIAQFVREVVGKKVNFRERTKIITSYNCNRIHFINRNWVSSSMGTKGELPLWRRSNAQTAVVSSKCRFLLMKPRQYPVPSAAVEVLEALVLSDAAVDADNDTNADAASDCESPPLGKVVVFVSSLVWTLCFSFQ